MTGLKSAQSRHSRAAERLHAAQTAANRAGQLVQDAAAALEKAERSLAERERQCTESASLLAKHIGVDVINSGTSAHDLLSVLRAAADAATAAESESREQLEKTTETKDAASQSLRAHEQHIAAEQKRIDLTRKRLQRTLERLTKTVEALPQSFRPQISAEPDIDAVDLKHLRPAPLKQLATSAQEHLDVITAFDAERDHLRSELDWLREQIEALDQERNADVVEPLAALRNLLLDATHVVKSSAKAFGAGTEEIGLSKGRTTSATRGDLQALTARVSVLLEMAAAAQGEAEDRRLNADTKLSQVLDDAEVKDLEAMADAKVTADAKKQADVTQVKNAMEAAATAEALEKQLGKGGQLVDDLERLMELLANRTFVGAILAQRSQALLDVASKRLEEMTGERYAFTSDFEILDELTGQPRDARTLSGGESFLASLALALGMVDLASRSGGRLDALFLDEGFGALDSSNLHSAVDALQATSSAGRMVAVVSHVKAIAERIDDVLVVMSNLHGSDVAWLDDVTRANLTEGDVQDALDRLLL